ncbi:MAG: FHA domain-containing protein [Myxococcota bacterium]
MTLAVLNGMDAGRVLRTGRSRIDVGKATDNDLVLRDADVRPHHFTIFIENEGWRAQTVSDTDQIVVDRRWAHPDSKRRGALIYAGGTEILLFPGDLDDTTIQRELSLRRTADFQVPDTGGNKEGEEPPAVEIHKSARRFGLDMSSLPPVDLDGDDNAPTLPLEALKKRLPPDAITLSSMPTIAGAPIPKAVQEVARQGLRPEQEMDTIQDGPPPEPARRGWSSGPPPRGARSIDVPEVLAVPESQMLIRPMEVKRNGASDPAAPRKNAWGERTPAENVSAPRRNSWGERQKTPDHRPEPAPEPSESPRSSSWDGTRRPSGAPAPEPPPPAPRLPQVYAGRELSMSALAERVRDPALQILREPDGEFATQIRVFGTRLQDLARTYGYRAYMLTSAEPLTGKTTVALNLAFALAEDPKRRIAFIEANFRYPRVADILGIADDFGLIGVLEGRLQVTESIVKIADRNLVVFPAGGRHPHPGEVLAAPRFKTLIAELATTVDVAIIDAPSVRPSADANLILPLVDAAMLVVLEGSTKAGWIDQAMDQLGRERVLGALYNKIDKQQAKALGQTRDQRLLQKNRL